MIHNKTFAQFETEKNESTLSKGLTTLLTPNTYVAHKLFLTLREDFDEVKSDSDYVERLIEPYLNSIRKLSYVPYVVGVGADVGLAYRIYSGVVDISQGDFLKGGTDISLSVVFKLLTTSLGNSYLKSLNEKKNNFYA